MTTLEEQKKELLPYVQRAQEVDKAEPKIAFYCRMYALEQGIRIKKDVRAPEISGLLDALMAKLEKDKPAAQLGTPAEDAAYCEDFALKVFNRADRVDRAGRADKSTAMTFYAASYFMDILNHFGQVPGDIFQKQRYAAWRAAEINKAVKEGRQPAPPPAAGQAALDDEAALLDELSKLEMAGGASSSAAAAAGAPPPPPPSAPLPPPAAPQPPAAAGGGDEGDGELRLPSPPKQRPIQGQRSGIVWVPPPPRRFQAFQKVLVRPDGSTHPVRGTVAKVEEGTHPEHPTYLVALPDHIATISDSSTLAPVLATGEAVMYHGPSGQSVEATVAEMDLGHWPPSYLVRLADGSYVDTTDDRLVQMNVPRPRSEHANLNLQGLPGEGQGLPGSPAGGLYPPPATGVPPPPPPAAGAAGPGPASAPAMPPAAHAAASSAAAASRPAAAAAAAPAFVPPKPVPGYQPGLREIADASKLSKSATSALQFEDVNTAVKLLGEALALLTQPPAQRGK